MEPLPAGIEPPITADEQGRPRTVGVEIELTGMDVGDISATVVRLFGGRAHRETDYLARVPTELGEFKVEADLHLLQKIGHDRAEHDDSRVVAAVKDAVAAVAEKIAPFEVVGPPLPWTELPRMDALAAELGRQGGRGSDAGVLLALGLQLNPQVPRLEAACIHAHLRAYALLEPWLRMRRHVDMARRLTPFVDPYPAGYVDLLRRQERAPDLAAVIDDYLRFNPTRNRSLDMLPLFAHLDRARVAAAVDDPRVKSRPTFHYRLPDSRIGHEGALVTDEWRHWLVVERVASRPDLMNALREIDDPEQADTILVMARFGA
jgi:hypothetical protein